jgi:hypothetical protein
VPARLDPVDELALFGIAEPLARELACTYPQRLDVRRQPWVVLQLREQLLRFLREAREVARLLRVDAPRPLLGAVVGVDEVVVVLPEPQAELDVAPGWAQRSNSAAWPCPTPTQSVASP